MPIKFAQSVTRCFRDDDGITFAGTSSISRTAVGVDVIAQTLVKRLLHPPLAALGEDGLEVAFEEGAGVLEVLFGVGFGGGDALKRFVEDADDPLLFGERGNMESTCAAASPSDDLGCSRLSPRSSLCTHSESL